MTSPTLDAIEFARAEEELRQERETFEERKSQEKLWFQLRLVMGYSAIALLSSVMVISAYILIYNKEFPETVIAAAGAALFGDVMGLLVSVWKIVFNPTSRALLEPVTRSRVNISTGVI
jgi:hypothetical protein